LSSLLKFSEVMFKGVWLVVTVGVILVFSSLWLRYKYLADLNFPDYSWDLALSDKELANSDIASSDKVELNLLWFGFVFWGRYINDWAMASPLKEVYPFSRLSDFEKDKYNAWIAQLDCPITDRVIDSKTMDQTLMFNCTPNYLPEASKWFEVFGLANSHTSNMGGLRGFQTTREYLDKYNIQYFGHFDKQYLNEICEVVSLPVSLIADEKLSKSANYRFPVAICGYHNTFSLATDEQLSMISYYAQYFPTFVVPIQGKEYPTTPDGLQKQEFRKMIDKGADVIVGASAHVVQAAEAYKGKLIFYSLGNFIFDQQFSEPVRSSAVLSTKLTFTVDDNLQRYLELGKVCQKFADFCLEKAAMLNLKKPRFRIQYDLLVADNSNRLAKKAQEPIVSIVLQRANWPAVLPQLAGEL